MLWCLDTEPSLDAARERRTVSSDSHAKGAVSSEEASGFNSISERRPRPSKRLCKGETYHRVQVSDVTTDPLSVERIGNTKSPSRICLQEGLDEFGGWRPIVQTDAVQRRSISA